jgi:drug/metabolite transporter (DMT)-like permease
VSATAFALAVAAAALHAVWNVLLAGARDVRAATVVALAIGVVVFAPVTLATWEVEAAAVPWLAASAGFETLYFFLLTAAYRRSDLSLVYPIARGAAPVLVLLGATAAGTAIGAGQAVGVVLGAPGDMGGVLLALVIAGTIAGYTLVDKRGIEHAAALPYLELALLPVAVVGMLAYAVTGRLGALRAEVGVRTAAAGTLTFAAYALALLALREAPAPAVAAVRETSILFAVALGAIVLRERITAARVAGAAVIVAGVAFVALL